MRKTKAQLRTFCFLWKTNRNKRLWYMSVRKGERILSSNHMQIFFVLTNQWLVTWMKTHREQNWKDLTFTSIYIPCQIKYPHHMCFNNYLAFHRYFSIHFLRTVLPSSLKSLSRTTNWNAPTVETGMSCEWSVACQFSQLRKIKIIFHTINPMSLHKHVIFPSLPLSSFFQRTLLPR